MIKTTRINIQWIDKCMLKDVFGSSIVHKTLFSCQCDYGFFKVNTIPERYNHLNCDCAKIVFFFSEEKKHSNTQQNNIRISR